MKKFKLFVDIEKEENWLNEQLQKGYRCKAINGLGVYTFEKMDEQYVMRLDYQRYVAKDKFENYQSMYEDFGWHLVRGDTIGGIQYWQKEADDQTEIFSDRQSANDYYKRIMNYTLSLGFILSFLCFLFYRDNGIYLTPGLWDMEGALFWKALLFETPFALMRLVPVMIAILLLSSSYKAYRKCS
ncbi:DUF2812 domain-containing protein [Caryophanon latum]|uniref:DUF2812 domain-containing protein n=1 Tax=Caryophanon latum TaxID=33977 RepID=A0A1C0YPW8_9BACL|nr:DUF2812 domain-containing protein [Caryophanon latum]OCS89220.1 hypothetical protein A6K76_12775 [Caryophanon latum]